MSLALEYPYLTFFGSFLILSVGIYGILVLLGKIISRVSGNSDDYPHENL